MKTDSCISDPVDPVELAEYLDGVLEPGPRERLEIHLVECPACRDWATEAGLAVAQNDQRQQEQAAPSALIRTDRARRSRPARRWLAVAAVLAGMTLAGLLQAPWRTTRSAEQLAAFGVDAAATRSLDAGHHARLLKALRAELEPVDYFDGFLEQGQQSVLRAESLARGPRLIAPRWSALRQTRPTFQWYPGFPKSGERHRGEILLVNDREQVVLTWPYDLPAADPGRPLEMSWIPRQAPLEPDRTYAWKVNQVIDGEWMASEYVPFRVLAANLVEKRLAPFADNDLQIGVEMAALGLYDEALEAFARARAKAPSEDVLKRLAGTILAHKRLTDQLAEKELQRWSLDDAD